MKKGLIVLLCSMALGIPAYFMLNEDEESSVENTTLNSGIFSESDNPFIQNVESINGKEGIENDSLNNIEDSELKPLPSINKSALVEPLPNATGKALAEPLPLANNEYEVINLLPSDETLEETNYSFGEDAVLNEGFQENTELQTGINGGGL